MPSTTVTAEEAAKLLQDASQDWQAFWFAHGAIAKNVREMSDALASMTDEQFEHHVNADKNDLANWLEAVVGDEQLAKKLRLLRTLAGTHAMVSRRVAELENCCRAAAPSSAPAAEAAAEPAPVAAAPAKHAAKKRAAKKTVTAKKEKAAAKPASKGSVWSKILKR